MDKYHNIPMPLHASTTKKPCFDHLKEQGYFRRQNNWYAYQDGFLRQAWVLHVLIAKKR
jgi:hypothetical protein